MSLSDLAAIGSFVSGIAVLGSLIFIGMQMRQNTQAMRAGASQANATTLQLILSDIIANADVARIWRQGLADLDSLEGDERVRMLMILGELFRYYEASRLQWRHGQLDIEHWQNVERQLRDIASQPGFRTFWKVRGHWHSDEFQKWFVSLNIRTSDHGLYEKA